MSETGSINYNFFFFVIFILLLLFPQNMVQQMQFYLSRFSELAGNNINCGPILNWLEVKQNLNFVFFPNIVSFFYFFYLPSQALFQLNSNQRLRVLKNFSTLILFQSFADEN